MGDLIPGDLISSGLLGPPFLAAVLGLTAAASALGAAGSIWLLRPLLVRYALARPNARSSHAAPTPQGGGIAVVGAALVTAAAPVALFGGIFALPAYGALAAATVALAALGLLDDVRPLSPGPRLGLQLAVVAIVVTLANPARILPDWVPTGLERAVLVVAGAWWVNLVNFMDGIDWMTVAEIVPITAVIALLGIAGILPLDVAAVAAALAGGLLGFAPANRPVARLFLGDVGSLPIGLLTGWMLLALASAGHLAAALILPLYYLADATLTLGLRARRGERVWEAHRSHYYQRALDNGFSVMAVDGRVMALNLALAGLAVATIWRPGLAFPAIAAAAALVGVTLKTFATRRSV